MSDESKNPYEPLSVSDSVTQNGEVTFVARIGIICAAVASGVVTFVGILSVTAFFTSLSGQDLWWVGGFIVSIPAALVCAERVNKFLLAWAGRALGNREASLGTQPFSPFDRDEP